METFFSSSELHLVFFSLMQVLLWVWLCWPSDSCYLPSILRLSPSTQSTLKTQPADCMGKRTHQSYTVIRIITINYSYSFWDVSLQFFLVILILILAYVGNVASCQVMASSMSPWLGSLFSPKEWNLLFSLTILLHKGCNSSYFLHWQKPQSCLMLIQCNSLDMTHFFSTSKISRITITLVAYTWPRAEYIKSGHLFK